MHCLTNLEGIVLPASSPISAHALREDHGQLAKLGRSVKAETPLDLVTCTVGLTRMYHERCMQMTDFGAN
jgi:hypothetical protein